jgi:hypothetical protein
MTNNNFSPGTIGGVALASGLVALVGLAFLVLFFTVGQPFGTLSDLCIAFAALLSGVLAWLLYPTFRSQTPQRSPVGLIAAVAGALVVVAGSALVILGVAGWFLAGLYMTAGNGLIGLWLLGLAYSALRADARPQGLVVFGLAVGVIMAVGLVAIPGILKSIDAQASASWVVLIGYVGSLGWILLYPIWCILLGRGLLLR